MLCRKVPTHFGGLSAAELNAFNCFSHFENVSSKIRIDYSAVHTAFSQQWPWELIQQQQHVSGLPSTFLRTRAKCRDLAFAQNMAHLPFLPNFNFGKTMWFWCKMLVTRRAIQLVCKNIPLNFEFYV